MNLARAQIINPHRPTYASINFTSSTPTNLPSPAPTPLARSSSSNSRPEGLKHPKQDKGKQKERVQQAAAAGAGGSGGAGGRKDGHKRRTLRNDHFVLAGERGYEIWESIGRQEAGAKPVGEEKKEDRGRRKRRDGPRCLRKRDLGGSLAIAKPLPHTPLLALVGGGRVPVYPPNKVVIYHDGEISPTSILTEGKNKNEPFGAAQGGKDGSDSDSERVEEEGKGEVVASIEYPEAVRSVVTRLNTLIVVLLETVIWYEYGMRPAPPPTPISPVPPVPPPQDKYPKPDSSDSDSSDYRPDDIEDLDSIPDLDAYRSPSSPFNTLPTHSQPQRPSFRSRSSTMTSQASEASSSFSRFGDEYRRPRMKSGEGNWEKVENRMHSAPTGSHVKGKGKQIGNVGRDQAIERDALNGKGKGKEKAEGEAGGFWLRKRGEWRTCSNPGGFAAISTDTGSCLLAIPGRTLGHIQLIQLSPCLSIGEDASPGPTSTENLTIHSAFRTPIIPAHTHRLSSLACTTDGKYVISSSDRGSIFRIWNVATGGLERELRRGVDKAIIWGVDLVYRPDMPGGEDDGGHVVTASGKRELWMVCWSDKGTIHIWGDVLGETRSKSSDSHKRKSSSTATPTQAINSLLKPYLPVPKYFQAIRSSALFRLPRDEVPARQNLKEGSSPSGPSMKEIALREHYSAAWAFRDPDPDVPLEPGFLASLQLIVVTHSGEWYKLSVPDRKAAEVEGETEDGSVAETGKEEETEAAVRLDRCQVIDHADIADIEDD